MITTLISGGTLELRLKELEQFSANPFPPFNLDGRGDPITIKAVREWSANINFSVDLNSLQHHFIIEAQNLTLPAQHSLLKILEEPPERTRIILTCDRPSSLLETILSRCQLIKLADNSSVDEAKAIKLLKLISTGSYSDLIKTAVDLKNNPDSEINNLLHFLRQHLAIKPTSNRAEALKLINQTLLDLKTNANKQLILEHCLFTLKSLTK